MVPIPGVDLDLSRAVVIGTSCSGKTTFARQLADLLASRHIEFDALHWLPDWVERDPKEFRALLVNVMAQESWVADGNYGSVRDLVWPQATAAIWLDYSFPRIMWRALARILRRVLRREALYSGNRESIRIAFFSRHSILVWVATTFHRRRRDYRELFDQRPYPGVAMIEFRRPRDAEAFLANVSPVPSASRRRSSCGA